MTAFYATDPATGEQLEPAFTPSTVEDVDRAVRGAAKAFESYAYASGARKAELLRAIAANLEARREEIVARAHRETALPLPRLKSELWRTTGQLQMFADLVEEGSWVDARIDTRQHVDLRSMLRPLGPVAVFGASNFPLAFSVAGGDTASALAAGCPVVVKAHPAHPGTSQLAGECIAAAAAEFDGLFSLLFDPGIEVGVELVRHPLIRAVAFTGSRRAGTAIMELAAKRPEPIPVYAEMGSVNPVFILPNALRTRGEEIAAGLQASVTQGVGQFCTNPGVVITPDDGWTRAFEEKLATSAPGTMLTAGICRAYHDGLQRLAATSGVEQRVRVESDPTRTAGAALFVTRAETFLANRELMEENFGPSTLVVHAGGGELLDIARALEGQLTITVWGDDEDLAAHRELLRILETKAGRLVCNGYPTGVEVSPAVVHGGPFPATSDGRSTSVGTRAIERFTRPVCWQNFPESALPPELRQGDDQTRP
ncbi:MAG TPA: aldehyde dehydrogenase (NADP(+)) [Thermoanaerobaculia bacterium]|jgi:NADP-dependent aldehyde dehydrogenase